MPRRLPSPHVWSARRYGRQTRSAIRSVLAEHGPIRAEQLRPLVDAELRRRRIPLVGFRYRETLRWMRDNGEAEFSGPFFALWTLSPAQELVRFRTEYFQLTDPDDGAVRWYRLDLNTERNQT